MDDKIDQVGDALRTDAVFHRDLFNEYPIVSRAEGSYLYTDEGTQYLDGSSGAVAANLGHGQTAIAQAMHGRRSRLARIEKRLAVSDR